MEQVFYRDFVAEYEAFEEKHQVPLIENGENIPVTNENRQGICEIFTLEFVDKYVDFILNKSIEQQFEPFKRGFYTVCGGNALSVLFMSINYSYFALRK